MTVHVVSTSKVVRSAFAPLERGRSVTLEWHKNDSGVIPGCAADDFLYIDISGMSTTAIRRKLAQLEKTVPYRFGLIDPKDEMADPAEVFHRSASDYLGRAQLKEGNSTARMKRVLDYLPHAEGFRSEDVSAAEIQELGAPASGPSWHDVERGGEYTFLMLYAGIDRVGDLRRKLSENFLAAVRKSLLSVVHQYLSPHGARLWMWKEDDGLLLLPFDGRSVDAVTSAILMRLNWPIHQTENQRDFSELSWRLGFHLGVTTYQTGRQTGEIVSEDVNFAFHLGGRCVEHGSIVSTEPVFRLLSPAVQDLFVPQGSFEGQPVYRLKRLL